MISATLQVFLNIPKFCLGHLNCFTDLALETFFSYFWSYKFIFTVLQIYAAYSHCTVSSSSNFFLPNRLIPLVQLLHAFPMPFHMRSWTADWRCFPVRIKTPFVQLDLCLVTALCISHCDANTWRTQYKDALNCIALCGKCDKNNYQCPSFYPCFH